MYILLMSLYAYIFTRRAYITYTPWQCFAQNFSMFLLAETDRCAHLNTHVQTYKHAHVHLSLSVRLYINSLALGYSFMLFDSF